MYLTFSEYAAYGGTITDETTFNDLEFEASSVIDWYTFNRLQEEETLPEAVKRCEYKIIQYIVAQQQVSGISAGTGADDSITSNVASQSNDGVSVSYNILSAKDAVENSKEQIGQIIKQYLSTVVNSLGQKVLYRGLYPNE